MLTMAFSAPVSAATAEQRDSCLRAVNELQEAGINVGEINCKVADGKHIYWKASDLDINQFKKTEEICEESNSYAMYPYESDSDHLQIACYYTSN